MKKLLLIVVCLAVMAFPFAAFAGVSGSDHDLRTSALDDNTGATSFTLDLCTSCHLPHNSAGSKLWSNTAGGSAVGDLCETCHDGTVVILGTNVFDGTSAHAHSDGNDATDKATCSGATSSCHDVHNQNANGTGKFLNGITLAAGADACAACHASGSPITGAADRTGTGNHTRTAVDCGGTGGCHVIATVHGDLSQAAATQSNSVETNGAGTWLLPIDNNVTSDWGGVCNACHDTEAAPYTDLIDGVATRDRTTFRNQGANETQHNTGTDGLHSFSLTMTGCNNCHYVHGNATDTDNFQKTDNTNSAYCASCHDGTTGPHFADGGSNSHPTDQAFTTVGVFPQADAINEDNLGGVDYSSNTATIQCETCHSVHGRKDAGANATPFLRADNTVANEICTTCHTTN